MEYTIIGELVTTHVRSIMISAISNSCVNILRIHRLYLQTPLKVEWAYHLRSTFLIPFLVSTAGHGWLFLDYIDNREGVSPHQNVPNLSGRIQFKGQILHGKTLRCTESPRVSPPDFGTQPSPARVKPKKKHPEERGVEMLVKAAQEAGAVFSWSIKSKQPTKKKQLAVAPKRLPYFELVAAFFLCLKQSPLGGSKKVFKSCLIDDSKLLFLALGEGFLSGFRHVNSAACGWHCFFSFHQLFNELYWPFCPLIL